LNKKLVNKNQIIMKKIRIYFGVGAILIAGLIFMAADHIDAPAVAGGTSDITDFYAFQGQNTDNLVFVANVQGLISPANTGAATFDENTLVEFNIDTDGDYVEDIIIQAIPRDGKMYFFGPYNAISTGLNSTVYTTGTTSSVEITEYGTDAKIATNSGMSFFAGPRDDPFFFDFGQYSAIIGGTASAFNDPGDDTFAGSNVMSIVVEVPKNLVGGSGTINTWVESKIKQ
jgi:hypothetical protein